MQSLSHYSPLNCSSLCFLVHILMFSLRYSEFCLLCACVVSHLMIPMWAARRKGHLSLSKFTRQGNFDWDPLELPRLHVAGPSASRRLKKIFSSIAKEGSWQLNAYSRHKKNNIKTGRMKTGVPRSEGSSHSEWVITWDRCLLDLFLDQNMSWCAVVSRSTTHRERKARNNNYSLKWVSCFGEHDLNKVSGEMSFGEETSAASKKLAQRQSELLDLLYVMYSFAHNWN